MNAKAQPWSTHLISLLYLVFVGVLFSWSDESSYSLLFLLFGGSFLGYLLLLYKRDVDFNYLIGVGFIAHLLAFIFGPHLSPDSYRFLWDGAITWMGENPLDSIPNELIHQERFANNEYTRSLYNGITELSKNNYTCYPTVNQFYFVAANISNSVTINLIVLKLLVFITQLFGLFYLWKLLKHFKLSQKKIFIIALNPLWIIETIGNIHFEGVMLSFLLIACYFLVKEKWIPGALFLAFAIHIKLVPLVLLPFFFRYLGWIKSILVYTVTMSIVVILALVYIRTDNYLNFLQSLTLYFESFEFNSLIYHHYINYGLDIFGYYPTKIYGAYLSKWGAILILGLAVFGGKMDFQAMATRMIFGMMIYYLFATTVHPWYILTILGLSVFTKFSFGIVWSGLIFMTYAVYSDWHEDTVQLLIHFEYAVLLGVAIYELIRKKPLLQFAE